MEWLVHCLHFSLRRDWFLLPSVLLCVFFQSVLINSVPVDNRERRNIAGGNGGGAVDGRGAPDVMAIPGPPLANVLAKNGVRNVPGVVEMPGSPRTTKGTDSDQAQGGVIAIPGQRHRTKEEKNLEDPDQGAAVGVGGMNGEGGDGRGGEEENKWKKHGKHKKENSVLGDDEIKIHLKKNPIKMRPAAKAVDLKEDEGEDVGRAPVDPVPNDNRHREQQEGQQNEEQQQQRQINQPNIKHPILDGGKEMAPGHQGQQQQLQIAQPQIKHPVGDKVKELGPLNQGQQVEAPLSKGQEAHLNQGQGQQMALLNQGQQIAPLNQGPGQQMAPAEMPKEPDAAIKIFGETKEPSARKEHLPKPLTKGKEDDEEPLRFNGHVHADAEEERIKPDDIPPPDHIEGVRMEQDGHLNRDYKKEIFLGHHDEFEWSLNEKLTEKVKIIFRSADRNRNGFLESNELKKWIMMSVKVHLDEAVKDNKKVFKHLDADKDGFVTWHEFFSHFLLAKGYIRSEKELKADQMAKLDTDEKERVLKYKYRWADADAEPKDAKLDMKEMMNFRHPEQSKQMIKRLVTEMMDTLDSNGDGIIDEGEFVALPPSDDNAIDPQWNVWLEERRKEFQSVIDRDKNGKADRGELELYFDPHNSNNARLEAENLILTADKNKDGKLSLGEVLNNLELFLGSKMVDAKRKLHDEF